MRLQRCLRIDNGGEELGLQELIDALETPAFRALAVGGVALVIQEHSQIVSKLVHDRELMVSRTRQAINYI